MNRAAQIPMSIAEAAECCGQVRWGADGRDRGEGYFETHCENCPLLIERREHPDVMRAARAL